MECPFVPGDEVVCMDDEAVGRSFWGVHRFPLRAGTVYRVRDVISPQENHSRAVADHNWTFVNEPHLVLEGIRNPAGGGFRASRFRRVEKPRANIHQWLYANGPSQYDEEQMNPAPVNPTRKKEDA